MASRVRGRVAKAQTVERQPDREAVSERGGDRFVGFDAFVEGDDAKTCRQLCRQPVAFHLDAAIVEGADDTGGAAAVEALGAGDDDKTAVRFSQ